MASAAYSEAVLEQIRGLVAQVKDRDLSAYLPDQPLGLDSMDRITMIVELENHFGIEIPEDEVMPEMFESLASMAAAVKVPQP